MVIVAGEEGEAVSKKKKKNNYNNQGFCPPQFSGSERWLAALKKIKSQGLVRLPADIYKALFKQTAGSCAT